MEIKQAKKEYFSKLKTNIDSNFVKKVLKFDYGIQHRDVNTIILSTSNINKKLSWKPVEKENIYNFIEFEEKYKIELNQSIKDYFNSYWHYYLTGYCLTTDGDNYDTLHLFPVLPAMNLNSDEFLYEKYGFYSEVDLWYKQYGKLEYIPIGFTGYYGSEILIENKSGKIKVCWNEYDDLIELDAKNLSELIFKMANSIENIKL